MSKRKAEDIKITRGVTDIENVLKHLKDATKSERQAEYIREYYSKRKLKKESND